MQPTPSLIARGTPAFRRTNLALFAAGFSTFALLYDVQPLMPLYSDEFGLSAAAASLSLSVTTGFLAVAMLVASSLSDALGRKPVMVASLLASAVLTLLAALVPGWHGLLLVRALLGLALSGLPAVAMAYVGEEMDKGSLGLAMGLYIAGSALGGMGGRLLSGVLADLLSWRAALGALSVLGLAAGLVVWRGLPPSANFRPQPLAMGRLLARLPPHFRDAGLPWLFALSFLLMGSFVTLYNYVGYRLLAPPYGLGHAEVGAIFAVYLVGIVSSAWMGSLASRVGRRKVLWATILLMLAGLGLTLAMPLILVVAGMALFTFGFFGAHSIASSWVGLRALEGKAQAASLYLFFYYLGSSVVGSLGGLFWSAQGWLGIVLLLGVILMAALAISLRLAALPPLPPGR
jgi:YNFM family putative membrane transporter